jgi:hypothetical protein
MRSPRWISALSIAAVLSATLLAAIWSFTAPRGAGKGGSPGSSPSRRETRPDANEVIARIQEAVRANRFEELRKLEDGLAAFGESALPEIRRALLVGTPGNDGMVEFWNSGIPARNCTCSPSRRASNPRALNCSSTSLPAPRDRRRRRGSG